MPEPTTFNVMLVITTIIIVLAAISLYLED